MFDQVYSRILAASDEPAPQNVQGAPTLTP